MGESPRIAESKIGKLSPRIDPVSSYVANHTLVGVAVKTAVKTAVDFAQRPEFKEPVPAVAFAETGVLRVQSMVDGIRGAVPDRAKAAVAKVTDRTFSPLATSGLRRGLGHLDSAAEAIRSKRGADIPDR